MRIVFEGCALGKVYRDDNDYKRIYTATADPYSYLILSRSDPAPVTTCNEENRLKSATAKGALDNFSRLAVFIDINYYWLTQGP